MFLLLGGQHVPGICLCLGGGRFVFLAGSLLAHVQPEEDSSSAVGQPPVSTSLYVRI